MTDHTELKRLAEAFPEYDYDSNTEPFFNGPSGESLGGGSTGFYCVYGPEFEIDGESYDGVTLVESCPADQAKFICEAKAGILALIAENDLQDRLIVENKTISDSFRAERDHLKAENEALRRQAETAQRGTGQLVAENEALRKGTGRYQWLRDKQTFIWLIQDWFPSDAEFTDVDAVIDAAMGKEAGHEAGPKTAGTIEVEGLKGGLHD